MLFYNSTVINNSCCNFFNDGLYIELNRFSLVPKKHSEYHNFINLKKCTGYLLTTHPKHCIIYEQPHWQI